MKRLPRQQPLRFPIRPALALWGGMSLLFATVLAVQIPLFVGYALVGAAVYFGILALLAVPLWRFCDVLARRRLPWWRTVLLHVGVGLLAIAVWQGAHFAFQYAVAGPEVVRYQIEESGLWQLFMVVVLYGLLVVAIVAHQNAVRLRRQRQREGELRLLAREAELKALRSQVRPHFLFNVLNSVYSMIPTRPEEAQEMVLRLSHLLRETLDTSDTELIPLGRELELARTYLGVERIRLGDRLTVEWSVDDELAAFLVPPLLLQPLIENAVQHGVASHPGPGVVEIAVRRERDHILLTIADSGRGDAGEVDLEGGHGLAITRRRLAAAYSDAARLELGPHAPRGVEARISVPLPEAGA